MPASLISHRISLPVGVVTSARICHEVFPEHLRVRDGRYSLARFDLQDGRRLFVIAERPDNLGPSAAQSAEEIATVVLSRYAADLEPHQVLFLERLDELEEHPLEDPASRGERISHDHWLITWRGRRAVFVEWAAAFHDARH